jgi:glyoxylase-like metal-dependent hydrolase (beta-lactamase superfamily II)
VNQTPAILHPISLGLVKAFLIQGDQAILVDTGMTPRHADRILAAMAERGIEPGDLSLIVLTHAHVDHCGGLSTLHQRTGAQIAIQEAGVEVLRLGISAEVQPASALGRLFGKLAPQGVKYAGAEPDTVFGEELDLYPFGVRGQLIHTPGHTPCSSSVVLPSGEALVGDLVMGIPFPRAARLPHVATNLAQVRESIQDLLALGVDTFYTAHGGPFAAATVRGLLG